MALTDQEIESKITTLETTVDLLTKIVNRALITRVEATQTALLHEATEEDLQEQLNTLSNSVTTLQNILNQP